MRIRTVYFKTKELEAAVSWWSRLLGAEPAKVFPPWREFRVGEINLGFLRLDAPEAPSEGRSCVPVFELPDDEVVERIERAKELGARVVLEGADHPDHPNPAAVLIDPFGNEFELTCLHD